MTLDKYLSEEKAARYNELVSSGVAGSFVETEEYKEFCALSDEALTNFRSVHGESKPTPFEGKCRRCGREFSDPIPELTHPDEHAVYEIASVEWCADCNAFAMSIVFRESSAYRIEKTELHDPMEGGSRHASS